MTVLVRSALLNGFDRQISDMIGNYMEKHGTKFKKGFVPVKVEKLSSGKKAVTYKSQDSEFTEEFDTVLVATGRVPETKALCLDKVGVKLASNEKILIDKYDRTNVPNIYSIGDCCVGEDFAPLELTPLAIQMGRLLAARLYGNAKALMDFKNIATTIFTPLEYGSVGYSEEEAVKKFKQENIEVYHTYFKPLEWTIPHREDNTCYMKVIVDKQDEERIIGCHVLSPNAGEVIQGYAVAIKAGATKQLLDDTVGIHPTISEEFTTLNVTKASGESPEKTGC